VGGVTPAARVAWAPDGRRVACFEVGGAGRACLVDLAGRVQALAVPEWAPVLECAWSPDGARLAVVSPHGVFGFHAATGGVAFAAGDPLDPPAHGAWCDDRQLVVVKRSGASMVAAA